MPSLLISQFAFLVYSFVLPSLQYSIMQPNKDQLHQVWLKCMQMTDCTLPTAKSFVNQVHPVLDTPLTSSGQTLIMLAASVSSTNLVKAVLAHQPQVHLKDKIGRTALHFAAAVGNLEIFELLVQAGARADEQTIGGETPLAKACIFGQGDIIQWYLNNSHSTFQIPDTMGKKPLDSLKIAGEALYQEVLEVYKQIVEDSAMKE